MVWRIINLPTTLIGPWRVCDGGGGGNRQIESMALAEPPQSNNKGAKAGRGCNYENDLEIAMFKYRASVGETMTWDWRKAKNERAGAKDWRPGRAM